MASQAFWTLIAILSMGYAIGSILEGIWSLTGALKWEVWAHGKNNRFE